MAAQGHIRIGPRGLRLGTAASAACLTRGRDPEVGREQPPQVPTPWSLSRVREVRGRGRGERASVGAHTAAIGCFTRDTVRRAGFDAAFPYGATGHRTSACARSLRHITWGPARGGGQSPGGRGTSAAMFRPLAALGDTHAVLAVLCPMRERTWEPLGHLRVVLSLLGRDLTCHPAPRGAQLSRCICGKEGSLLQGRMRGS